MGPTVSPVPIAESRQGILTFVAAINAADLDAPTRRFTRPVDRADTQIVSEPFGVVSAGDSLLVRERWRIRSRGSDGVPFSRPSVATLLLRCLGSDWMLVIAAPWGWGAD